MTVVTAVLTVEFTDKKRIVKGDETVKSRHQYGKLRLEKNFVLKHGSSHTSGTQTAVSQVKSCLFPNLLLTHISLSYTRCSDHNYGQKRAYSH